MQVYELLASDEGLLNDTIIIKTADHGEVRLANSLPVLHLFRQMSARTGPAEMLEVGKEASNTNADEGRGLGRSVPTAVCAPLHADDDGARWPTPEALCSVPGVSWRPFGLEQPCSVP